MRHTGTITLREQGKELPLFSGSVQRQEMDATAYLQYLKNRRINGAYLRGYAVFPEISSLPVPIGVARSTNANTEIAAGITPNSNLAFVYEDAGDTAYAYQLVITIEYSERTENGLKIQLFTKQFLVAQQLQAISGSIEIPAQIEQIRGYIFSIKPISSPLMQTQKCYFGVGATNQNSSAFVLGLQASLCDVLANSVQVTVNAGQHIYYAYPAALGLPEDVFIKGQSVGLIVTELTLIDPVTGISNEFYLLELTKNYSAPKTETFFIT
jgi:hypothetical protein